MLLQVDSNILKTAKQTQMILYKSTERDLKSTIPYLKEKWGFQNNKADKKSNFIYRAEGFDDLMYEHSKNPFDDINYTVRRYYNHVTSTTIENIFCAYDICQKEENVRHKTIDFYILEKPFDLKVSSFPKKYSKSKTDFKNDREYRNDLIVWLYNNQSKEGRYHEGNRLFIVCKDGDGKNSYKNNLLKMNFGPIQNKIENYLNYSLKNLSKGVDPFNKIVLPNGKEVLSDLIFVEN